VAWSPALACLGQGAVLLGAVPAWAVLPTSDQHHGYGQQHCDHDDGD